MRYDDAYFIGNLLDILLAETATHEQLSDAARKSASIPRTPRRDSVGFEYDTRPHFSDGASRCLM